jgi:hypothetical protein
MSQAWSRVRPALLPLGTDEFGQGEPHKVLRPWAWW